MAQTACTDSSTWFWLRDELSNYPITSIGPNDTIFWEIYCLDQNSPDTTIIWTFDDIDLSLDILPTGNYNDSVPVFTYRFTENSCNCTAPATGTQEYLVLAKLIPYCSVNTITDGRWVKIKDPVEALFD